MLKLLRLIISVCVASIAAQSFGFADELPTTSGPVLLTVAGKIEQTNRPAFDDFEDAFLKYHEKSFDRAAEFDLPMLESLGMHEVEVSYEKWPKAYRFEGPRLKDLLGAVGASGDTITVFALDGYASEISKESLETKDWIVAVKRDGEYLKLGQRGPVWMVHDPGADKKITRDEESKWVWTVFYMEIE